MLNSFLPSFIDHIKFEGKSLSNTIRAYRFDIEEFIDFLGDQELSPTTISEWLEFLHKSQKSPKTISRKLSSLRSFFHFLVQNNLETKNYFELFSSPKQNQHVPYVLPPEQMIDMLLHLPETDILERRNKVMLILMYGTGMRSEELCGLKLSDFDPYNSTIRVLGKGQKERLVPLISFVQNSLISWLDERSNLDKHDDPHLFLSKNGQILTTSMIRKIVDSISKNPRYKDLHPHAFRYSCATHLLDQGANLRYIQELLGHASISVTQRYTKLSLKNLKESYNKFHPRA
ncbi:MAG: tyrosine-type recombinase/integrase [Brevinema sp.]